MESLNARNKTNPLSQEKKDVLLKSIHTRMYLREKLAMTQKKINMFTASMEKSKGFICAAEIRTGVKVEIGNAAMYVRDTIYNARMFNSEGKIMIGEYTENPRPY